MNFGPTEILIVLGIVVLLFGAKKLPELARSLGRSSSEFKKGMQEGTEEAERTSPPARAPEPTKAETPQPAPPADPDR
ncbi:MAG: twin-arginine translocase TatA/TatE family subunit [Candidatus Velamenicoccus archaeovorus]